MTLIRILYQPSLAGLANGRTCLATSNLRDRADSALRLESAFPFGRNFEKP